MAIRKTIVAGQFYPADKPGCLAELQECLSERKFGDPLPQEIVAGIVPHAGWVFSGSLAGMVYSAIKQLHDRVDTFILFGAVHGHYGMRNIAAVYDAGSWDTPLGEIPVDSDLACDIIARCPLAEANPRAHSSEHSIEVQLPFIKHMWPQAAILPIMVMPQRASIEMGAAVGKVIMARPGQKIVCIGSTDLTHYGPRYGFDPAGAGAKGLDWARNVNDSLFINAALRMEAADLIATAAENHNACGAGAAAATVAAAKEMGKTKGILLEHANSNDIMQSKFNQTSEESVGYAGIVF